VFAESLFERGLISGIGHLGKGGNELISEVSQWFDEQIF
jgi:hypothetical protein